MNVGKEQFSGIALCFAIALPCWYLGEKWPIIGGPVFAILAGMILGMILPNKNSIQAGITFTSKKILQLAVIFLGFGLNLSEIVRIGTLSLPVIIATISIALVIAFALQKTLKVSPNIATLVGVGSAICGGSAIAATAPVIEASDEEIAQSISTIFLFNVIAALIFPTLGSVIGLSDAGFGLFAGTAINDTSSVTAAATAWDGLHPGAKTLEAATIVKLTRTLAIIPITLALAFYRAKQMKQANSTFSLRKVFPMFILFFLAASIITTVAALTGIDPAIFKPLQTLSKFFIVTAMAAIGLSTNIGKMIRNGGESILIGACCWVAISITSLGMQQLMGIW